MDRPQPLICHSLWGHDGDLETAIARAQAHGFDGLEANLDHGALSAHEPQAVVERMIAVTEAGLRSGEGPVEYEADLRYPGAPASREQEGGQTIRRLKEAQGRDPVFTDWVRLPGVMSRLQQLLGPRVVMPLAHHNCVMTKQPQFSSETHWHQDIRYWSFTRPELVILDEPTTALDVTTQVEVLKTIKAALAQSGATAIYVSHDLAVVAQVADRIAVLKDGRLCEEGAVDQILAAPQSDYARTLVAAAQPQVRPETPETPRPQPCHSASQVHRYSRD